MNGSDPSRDTFVRANGQGNGFNCPAAPGLPVCWASYGGGPPSCVDGVVGWVAHNIGTIAQVRGAGACIIVRLVHGGHWPVHDHGDRRLVAGSPPERDESSFPYMPVFSEILRETSEIDQGDHEIDPCDLSESFSNWSTSFSPRSMSSHRLGALTRARGPYLLD